MNITQGTSAPLNCVKIALKFTHKICGVSVYQQNECDRGHEWTEENTYTMPSGAKICYACNRLTNWGKAGFHEFPDAVYTGLDPL